MTRHLTLLALRLSGVALIALCLSRLPGLGQAIVYDPSNYAQNVLQAARALEQISHQITSLQNQAQMLVNQTRNLTNLPYSSQQSIGQSFTQTRSCSARLSVLPTISIRSTARFSGCIRAPIRRRPRRSSSQAMRKSVGRILRPRSRICCASKPASSNRSRPPATRRTRWSQQASPLSAHCRRRRPVIS